MQKRLAVISIGLLLLVLFLTGCGSSRQQSFKPTDDWSRGVQLADTVTGIPGMAMSRTEDRIHLIWPVSETGNPLHYLQMGVDLEVLVDQDLTLPVERSRTVRIAPAGSGELHLLFASRSGGGEPWELDYARLDGNGNLVEDPARISPAGLNVEDYDAAPDGTGGVVVAWDTAGQEGIFLAHLSPTGELLQEPFELVAQGENPSLRVDFSGNLHLVWLGSGNQFLYASAPLAALNTFAPQRVADTRIGTGDTLNGPKIGVTREWVYIFWSILRQSGLEAGTAQTEYIAFPIGEPGPISPETLAVLSEEYPSYQSYNAAETGLGITELVPAPASVDRSEFIYQPATPDQPVETMTVAVVVNQGYRADAFDQVAVAVFEDGQYLGYSNAAKTTGLSSDPQLVVDGKGSLYLTWREGYSGSKIYYASTAAAVREELDRLTPGDVANLILTGGMEGLTSILFFPIFGFGWALPGFLILGLYKLFQDDEDLRRPLSWVILILAIVVFEIIKFASLPSIFFYVPFSAWMEVPELWRAPLQTLTPWLIPAVAFLVAEVVRRRRGPATLFFYVVFVVVDGILTLAIYGVSLMGVG